jgi:flagellar hook-associated protein 3 FlgL
MRVSNALVTRSITSRLQEAQRALLDAQQRATTGKRVQVVSDDPTSGSTIMQVSGALRGLEQYARNVGAVKTRLDAEDSALGQVTELLTRARELGVAANTSTIDAAGRRAVGIEVRQLLQQALAVGNTKVADEYLFGGHVADRPPFDTTRAAQVPPFAALDAGGAPAARGERFVEVAAGQTMRGAHDGATLFVDTGLLAGLQAMADALDPAGATPPRAMPADQRADLNAALATLEGAFTAVQGYTGEIGARQNQVDTFASGLEALKAAYTTQRSDLAEVDMEQAITEMMQRQMAYQAAMLASSKIMGLSLADYIR